MDILTHLALEAAEQGGPVTVVDLDIVNPYFRSSEYRGLLSSSGVRLIAPVFAGTTLDTPTLPPEISSIFEEDAGKVFIDAGGDDAGYRPGRAAPAAYRSRLCHAVCDKPLQGLIPDPGGSGSAAERD